MKKTLFLNIGLLAMSLFIVSFSSGPGKSSLSKGTTPSDTKKRVEAPAPRAKASQGKEEQIERSKATQQATENTAQRCIEIIKMAHPGWPYSSSSDPNLVERVAVLLAAQEEAYHKRFDTLERQMKDLKAELTKKKII